MSNHEALAVVSELLASFPEFTVVSEQAQSGDVLPYLVFGELAVFMVNEWKDGDTALVDRLLRFLDAIWDGEKEAVRDLISLGFVENVGVWQADLADFIATWPGNLRSEALRQATWRPHSGS